MSALAALSKYQVQYPKWQQIRQRYGLKWSNERDSIESFQKLFGEDALTYETMLQAIMQMTQKLPTPMAKIVKYSCLVGLRPAENIESIKLQRP